MHLYIILLQLQAEGVRQQEKIKLLEIMVEKLPAGQQGFQHQINHHIKIKVLKSLRHVNAIATANCNHSKHYHHIRKKNSHSHIFVVLLQEENWSLRSVNEQLSAELRRTELLFAGVSDELARYRASEQKSPSSHMYEEQCLRKLLQV